MDISSRVTPARLYRSRLDAAVQSSVALLGVIRCSYNPFLLGHGLRRCLKNLPTSKVSSVSYEQIRVALFFFKIVFDFSFYFFFISIFFIKIIITSLRGRTSSESEARSFLPLKPLPPWARLRTPS